MSVETRMEKGKEILAHIEAVVWDLDGTLYRYNDLFLEACNVAATRTAIAMGLPLSYDEALDMAVKSEILHGSSFKLFEAYGLRYEDFHDPYHKAVDAAVVEKNAALREALESLAMPMVILTNASRDWARRTLDHLEYSHLFPDARLLALEDVGFRTKSQSADGFLKALSMMGAEAGRTLMVEDLPHNLHKAKEIGMTTALVRHGRNDRGDAYTQKPAHVDLVAEDTLSLLGWLPG
ncbi:MAG: HAD family hydrolase [Micavibrio sp.]